MSDESHQSYRPDIDGLRAIAVLAVIAFHASSRLLPGGFIGVDVFFVLSGFLITGLIVKALDKGTFSFTTFYTRRIKRILPVYIVVALATLLAASWLLVPNDFLFYTTSLAASWAFAANIFFSMLSFGYFGQRTEEFPLLHTWSLSVEEQFYFVFPILLLFLFRYLRRHTEWILVALGIAFTVLSQSMTEHVRSYFLLSSRAQELIIGALTFFLIQKKPVVSRGIANTLAWAGMALMVGSLALIDRRTPFPGVNSLYPCLGVAMLIYAGGSGHVLTPLLKSRLLVSIGLMSYSLYLWHWPIFAFLRYRYADLGAPATVAAIGSSFVLSWLTWKFVETPIRVDRSIGFSTAFARYYAAPAMLFLSVGLGSYLTEGVPQRFPKELRQLMASYSTERNLSHACSIRSSDYQKVTLDYLLAHCAVGDPSQEPGLLLMGDSHANHFRPFVEQMARDARLKMLFHVQGSCLPTDLFETATPRPSEPTTCNKHNLDLLQLAGSVRFVALGGNWATAPDPQFETKLEAVVDKIVKAGATPMIFKDNPFYEPDRSHCIVFKRRAWLSDDTNCNIPLDAAARTQAAFDSAIDRVAARHPGAVVIDPKLVMCNDTECATSLGNIAVYRDPHHINAAAATLLGQKYIEMKGNPLAPARGSFLLPRHP